MSEAPREALHSPQQTRAAAGSHVSPPPEQVWGSLFLSASLSPFPLGSHLAFLSLTPFATVSQAPLLHSLSLPQQTDFRDFLTSSSATPNLTRLEALLVTQQSGSSCSWQSEILKLAPRGPRPVSYSKVLKTLAFLPQFRDSESTAEGHVGYHSREPQLPRLLLSRKSHVEVPRWTLPQHLVQVERCFLPESS